MITPNLSQCHFATWLPLVVIALLGQLAGCSSKEATHEVSGVVSYEGKPLNYGIIRFVATASNSNAAGEISEGGNYTLELPAGNYAIGVEAVPPFQDYEPDPRYEGGVPPNVKRQPGPSVPTKYNDPLSSGLTCTVGEAGSSHDISLP